MRYEELFRERITSLRVAKHKSEYQMSLDLGRCQGYIQSITSGRSLPSFNVFIDICTYLGMTPSEMLDPDNQYPELIRDLIDKLKKMEEEDLILMLNLADKILRSYERPET